MNEILIVVDMQNDFIDGALGTAEAEAILPAVEKRISEFKGRIIFTRDTHEKGYLETQEGRKLPVEHCMKGSDGWEIRDSLRPFVKEEVFDKPGFGSVELSKFLSEENVKEKIDKITLIGLCTDICVISNAMMIKAFLPETEIVVDSKCCAGVTPESHETALNAMKACQISIL